jgi:hypothetical protein
MKQSETTAWLIVTFLSILVIALIVYICFWHPVATENYYDEWSYCLDMWNQTIQLAERSPYR